MEYKTIIGLEIHIQLKTKRKMFCSCDNAGEDKPPNTFVCPVCMGHPGVLPVINQQAIEWALMFALALDCKINKHSKFDRKSYFYPDLPKGYQISQYDEPLAQDGHLIIDKGKKKKRIKIERVHIEEDAAKLLHPEGENYSLVDFNRAGTPLLEIVTKPDIETPQEAKVFLQELKLIAQYLDISDADMEKGHLRCDVNISLRPQNEKKLYPKTEIKNLNSFRAVERALVYEVERQKDLWEEGKSPQKLSTRGWDEGRGVTIEQRAKEEAQDYRYFSEPDLPPLEFDEKYIEELKVKLPELPYDKRKRFQEQYELDKTEVNILTANRFLADYTEEVISELKAWLLSLEETEGTEQEIWKKHRKKLVKLVANWLINKLSKLLLMKNLAIENMKITPENFAEFITLVYQNKISSQVAREVLEEMLVRGKDPSNIIEERGLSQVSDESQLAQVVELVIKNNPQVVKDYQGGKINALQFLVGQIMKETKGRANPEIVRQMLEKKLK